MVGDFRPLVLIGTDNGYIAKAALSSAFVDHRPATCPQLIIKDEVLHLV